MVTAAEAAIKAHVDKQAVHAWCRTGRVKAVKRAGAWDIDPESLAAHMDLTEALVTAFLRVGGTEWTKMNQHRVYIPTETWQDWAGLVLTKNDGGRPNGATLDGRPFTDTNGGIGKLNWALPGKIYFDAADHTLVIHGNPYLMQAFPATWADGDRADVVLNLAACITSGAAQRTGLDFDAPDIVAIGRDEFRRDIHALVIPVTASPLEAP